MFKIAVSLPVLVFSSSLIAGERQLLWGDTHLHTSNSFDAYIRNNRSAGPDDAYRYATGLPVIHPYSRARVQIETPLDFLVVADHAEYLGVIRTVNEGNLPRQGLGWYDRAKARVVEFFFQRGLAKDDMSSFGNSVQTNKGAPEEAARISALNTGLVPNSALISRNTWVESTDLADVYNKPGTFTAMIGWEWSPIPGGANLHRVILTDSDAKVAQSYEPFGMGHSPYPEDLWAWLEETSASTEAEFIAIPHNSNISKGYMFPETTIKGEAVTAEYARMRAKWEPVVEATQIKGDSETIGRLSPDDEFADFETYGYYIQAKMVPYNPDEGDYVRGGLKRGLVFDKKFGLNPYKFGLIGSTDAHTGMPSAEEQNFHGKMARDGIPENKKIPEASPLRTSGWAMSAQGLAAVWADHNDRESIMAAFKRKEVYATTGTRISLRMFAGWNFTQEDLDAANFVDSGYQKGVPMGGDLLSAKAGDAPRFLIHAARDPKGANLDRVQVIKGWLDDEGQSQERVYDVAWAGDRVKNAAGKVPAIGNTVNLKNATYINNIGEEQLASLWTDPEFSADQKAFYYVRVLEIPTPRHALADALALGMEAPDRGPSSIQERAYSSPIWYNP